MFGRLVFTRHRVTNIAARESFLFILFGHQIVMLYCCILFLFSRAYTMNAVFRGHAKEVTNIYIYITILCVVCSINAVHIIYGVRLSFFFCIWISIVQWVSLSVWLSRVRHLTSRAATNLRRFPEPRITEAKNVTGKIRFRSL